MVAQIWDRLPENLSLPKYVDYKSFQLSTKLSARALSSSATQAVGIVNACISKARRQTWVKNNKNPAVIIKKFSKPKLNFIAPQLSSKCYDWQNSDGKFLGFARLKSLGLCKQIIIPIIRNPRANGSQKGGITCFQSKIQLAWETPTRPAIKGEKVVGIDQGLVTVATLSDGQISPKECPHGHSSASILETIARRKKGSKGFKRAAAHYRNFVNYSINNLDFQNLKEVRLEKIVNIRKGRRSSRMMSHWRFTLIRDKILRTCEELEVPVIEQSCAYRSQRCNQCGNVRKANRKAKVYSCKRCKWVGDSDLNAALNHEQTLPEIPFDILGSKLNIGEGFLWTSLGCFSLDGKALRVPCS